MYGAFESATAFNEPIGTSWNVARVANMANLFSGAMAFNQNIAAWNTASVYHTASMRTPANPPARLLARTPTLSHARTHARPSRPIGTHTHTNTHTHLHTLTRARARAGTYTRGRTHMRARTHTHADTHTHTLGGHSQTRKHSLSLPRSLVGRSVARSHKWSVTHTCTLTHTAGGKPVWSVPVRICVQPERSGLEHCGRDEHGQHAQRRHGIQHEHI